MKKIKVAPLKLRKKYDSTIGRLNICEAIILGEDNPKKKDELIRAYFEGLRKRMKGEKHE